MTTPLTTTIPVMPTFTAGALVHQGDLNALAAGVNDLSLLLTGALAPRSYIPTLTISVNTQHPIPTGADTTVTFDTAGLNNDGMWAVSNDHVTIKTNGVYLAWAQLEFDSNGTGHRAAHIMLNGASITANSITVTAVNSAQASADTIFTCVTLPLRLTVGAALYLSVFQNSGGNLNLSTGLSGSFFSVARIGA